MAGRQSKLHRDAEVNNGDMLKTVCKLLAQGITDRETCAQVGISPQTFYTWLQKGSVETTGVYREFLDAVTRARSDATIKAIAAFRTGLTPTTIKEEMIETVSETRLDRDGNPYQYTKTITREKRVVQPPDWRAGMEWLQRRDKGNWSARVESVEPDEDTQLIADIRNGVILFGELVAAFDEDEAVRLFKLAGVDADVIAELRAGALQTVQTGEAASDQGGL
jgi:hypothetical protein